MRVRHHDRPEELESAVGEFSFLGRHREARVAHAELGRQAPHLVQAAGMVSAGSRSAQGVDPNYPKYDPPTTAFTRGYIFVQFWLLTAASLWLLQVEKDLPRAFVLLLFAWMCFSLYVQGAWLEGRAHARRLEWIRIALTVALAIAACSGGRRRCAEIAVVLAAYAVASAAAMGIERMLPAARLRPA